MLTPAEAAALAKPAHVTRFPVTDRDSWLRMRGQDVTASAIAAVVGAHPHQTPFGLYCQKTGLLAEDPVEPKITENSISLPPMLRGTELEDVAPRLLRKLRPAWQIEPCGYYYRDADVRIGATPDFLAVDPCREGLGVIQVKTSDQFAFREKWLAEDRSIEVPLWIVIQTVVEATLTGASWAAVAVMVMGGNLDLHLIEVPIHVPIMDRLKAEVVDFWAMVEARTPPDPDYRRDGATIAGLYPDDNGMEIDLSADNRLPDLADERDRLKADIKALEEHTSAIDAEFKHRLGPHESARLAGGRRVTLKTTHRKGYEVKPTSYRSLRFSKSK